MSPGGQDFADARGIACTLMRGGTSKGAYFLASDLPADAGARDDLLLRVMGSPDSRQIDGIGGAHPLTSKVAVVSRSEVPGVDVDYLFLQIGIEEAQVSSLQTCGNLLAGVGPFAIERALIAPAGDITPVRIRLLNTGGLATATVATPDGRVDYSGEQRIDGVPGSAAPIPLELDGGEERTSLLPTGHPVDEINGHRASLIAGEMPVVLLDASEFGITGAETPQELEANDGLLAGVEEVRIAAGALMGLGDVGAETVPKMFLLSPPRSGGAVATRALIPHRVHTAIGVLMAASVAAGIRIPGTVGHALTAPSSPDQPLRLEHPTGAYDARVRVEAQPGTGFVMTSTTNVRTARKLFEGRVFPRPAPGALGSPVREDTP